MRKLITGMLFLGSSFFSYAQTTYVPDDNFENYLETHNANGEAVVIGDPTSMGNGIANDDSVSTANINNVFSLDVNNQNIFDLTGIEDFSSLVQLICRENSLTALNISQNTLLEDLYCQFNELFGLDITQNTSLKKLYTHSNFIKSLDLSKNTQLTHLVVNNNRLTTLNVTKNVDLRTLEFYTNEISTIDLTQNTLLQSLKTGDNLLTSLDLSNNINLEIAQIENNQISTLSLTPTDVFYTLICNDNLLTSLDFSLFNSFGYLNCKSNRLTSLNVKNGNNTNFYFFNTTSNPDLTCIEVDDTNWSVENWTDTDNSSTFVNNQTECTALSIDEFTPSNIKMYPNPVNNYLHISSQKEGSFMLITPFGQLIEENSLLFGENTINTSNLPVGLYLLKIKIEGESFTNKVYIK